MLPFSTDAVTCTVLVMIRALELILVLISVLVVILALILGSILKLTYLATQIRPGVETTQLLILVCTDAGIGTDCDIDTGANSGVDTGTGTGIDCDTDPAYHQTQTWSAPSLESTFGSDTGTYTGIVLILILASTLL